jgi:hypothetical protein
MNFAFIAPLCLGLLLLFPILLALTLAGYYKASK